MKRIFLSLICLLSLAVSAQYYQLDVLGDGYRQHTFVMPDDYHGEVVSTLVRLQAPDTTQRAVLYVHGYNDYFFQDEMARRFVDNGYNFYAIDLRKYGRSLREGQFEFEARNMNEYFADIDSALMVIKREGNRQIVLMGHSTGGLTTSLYCQAHRQDLPVDALILNSPFFEWNFNALYRNFLIPMVAFIGKFFPDWGLPDAKTASPYGLSLIENFTFNTEWKKLLSRGERFGWIRAIDRGHDIVHNEMNLPCPILLLHSDKTIRGKELTPEYHTGDAVLDVEHISKYGSKIGANVTEVTIPDALHDVILSRPDVRENAYNTIFEWLNNVIKPDEDK